MLFSKSKVHPTSSTILYFIFCFLSCKNTYFRLLWYLILEVFCLKNYNFLRLRRIQDKFWEWKTTNTVNCLSIEELSDTVTSLNILWQFYLIKIHLHLQQTISCFWNIPVWLRYASCYKMSRFIWSFEYNICPTKSQVQFREKGNTIMLTITPLFDTLIKSKSNEI